MKTYEIQQFGVDQLALTTRDVPKPAPGEVLVKLHAASVNYRDLMMISGTYNPRLKFPLVPFSDGAGEVIETGSSVSRWMVGDRVMPIFMQGWINGEIDAQKARTTLGGDRDGVLREFAVFPEESLVEMPRHLSYMEAATLPCAALTAWNALVTSGKIKRGDHVLLQGTGGVSIFALQFAKLFGARVILISGSEQKIEKAGALGADFTINYRERPDWDRAILEITEKRGVDHVIEVGGAGTMQRSLNSVKIGGDVSVIGVLSGAGNFDPVPVLMKAVRMQGIFVGSRAMFETMTHLLSIHRLQPVIDKTFSFDNAREALHFMESAQHFGKIVIQIS